MVELGRIFFLTTNAMLSQNLKGQCYFENTIRHKIESS
jgi:hypothetical protein